MYFAVVEHGAREGMGGTQTQKGRGHHTYHSPGITRVVPPALSCARRLAGAQGEEVEGTRGRAPETLYTHGPRAAGGRTNENEVTRGRKQFRRQFGRSWRCTITEDITNSWMRARQ